MKILYQAKRKDNAKWIYGYLVRYGYTGKEKDYIIPFGITTLDGIEVISETIGQYVNRDDIKGNSLFVGDIVDLYVSNSYAAKNLVIKFDEERCSFVAAGELSVYPLLSRYNWKKTGNIHNN